MKTLFLTAFIGLMLASYSLTAAKPDPIWKTGILTLTNGTRIQGELYYNWKAEIVQLHVNGMVKAYSAFQVDHFSYFDEESNALRRFSAVEYPVRKTFNRPVFLEEVTTGSMTVYRRLRHVREPLQIGAPGMYTDDELLASDYNSFVYFVSTDDSFANMDHFNRDIWPRMTQEFGPQLKQYVTLRQLDVSDTVSRLILINQYNYLKARTASGEPLQPVETVVAEEAQPK